VALFISSWAADLYRANAMKVAFGIISRGIVPGMIFYYLTKYHKWEEKGLACIIVGVGYVAFGAIWEVLTGKFLFFERNPPEPEWFIFQPSWGIATGTVGLPLILAVLMNLVFPFCVYKLNKSPKVIYPIALFLLFTAIGLSFRRTGWFFSLVGAILILLLIKPKRRFVLTLFIIILLNLSLLFIPSYRSNFFSRFDMHKTFEEIKVGHRARALKVATKIFLQHPLTGIGIGNYGKIHEQYSGHSPRILTPDNQLLRFLSEGGLLTLGAFMALWGFLGLQLFKYRRDPFVWFAGVSFILFSCNLLFSDVLYFPPLSMTFWALFGMCIGRIDRMKSNA